MWVSNHKQHDTLPSHDFQSFLFSVIHCTVVTVQLAHSDFTVEEGSGSVAVQLTKSGQTASSFSVILITTNGSAEGNNLCVVIGLVTKSFSMSLLYYTVGLVLIA